MSEPEIHECDLCGGPIGEYESKVTDGDCSWHLRCYRDAEELSSGPRTCVTRSAAPVRWRIAAMAMQGLLGSLGYGSSQLNVAEASVEYADALIAELNKPQVRQEEGGAA